MLTLSQLINKIKKSTPDIDVSQIKKAYSFAVKYHQGQKRKDGTPFIQHPLAVVKELSQFKFNTETFVAALLHDVVEDTEANLDLVRKEFGGEVTKLISGVTKLSKIKLNKNLEEYSIENLRKMFLAMAQDIRVVLIKLADRLHNLKTLKWLSPGQRKRIAKETIEIYAPLANRLGMGELKGCLEDLAFPYLLPKEYKKVKKLITTETEKREKHIEKTKKELEKKLLKAHIDFIDIHGRAKHLYSFFKKLQRYNYNVNNIYDLVALRVIVKTVIDCYKTLGVIHKDWKPLIGRIKDYIAVPKTNGYQSLHTTVLTPSGDTVEIQIRTPRMHREAEYGIAASWYYAESGKQQKSQIIPKKLAWINQLIKWQKELQDNEKFAEVLKIDFFKDRIFVFTPQGEVLDLPDGSTPVDFAYHIHTDIGNHCKAVLINDQIASLDTRLKNGDVIKIITSQKQTPKRDWLTFVHTKLAQSRIKSWFKAQDRDKSLEYGKHLLNQELLQIKGESLSSLSKNKIGKVLERLHYKTFDDLLVAIAEGEVSTSQAIKYIYSKEEILPIPHKKYIFFGKPVQKLRAVIEGEEGLLTNIAKCCNPVIGDKIKAYITRSKGASVHQANCKELKKLKDKGRIVNAYWQKDYETCSLVDIELQTLDRVGLLRDVSVLISNSKINIANLKTVRQSNDIVNLFLTLEIKNIDQLVDILHKLRKIKGILKVEKK